MSDLHVCTACFARIDHHPGGTCCTGCACFKYGRERDGAIFGDEAEHGIPRRYLLWRTWDLAKPQVLFLVLYPGVGAGSVDDAAVKRCRSYAQLWGFGGLEIAALYSVQVEHARALFAFKDPIGPLNDQHLIEAALRTRTIVCAWGASAGSKRVEQVMRKLVGLGRNLEEQGPPVGFRHLGFGVDGQPQNVLRAPTLQSLVVWKSDCESCELPCKHDHCAECGAYDHAANSCPENA